MYCIKCGVKLANTEKVCPLCNTTVFHPDLVQGDGERLYPVDKSPVQKKMGYLPHIFLSFAVLLAIVIVFMCDIQISNTVSWSGYVMGALVLAYVFIVLPLWFRDPNPVIFAPIDFVAVGTYLLYVNLYTGGKWFLSFAFPVVGGIGILLTALIALLRYVKRGKLYIVGGFFVLLGAFMMLVEFLISITFGIGHFLQWSLYPLVALGMMGIFLIFLAAYPPAKELMERKFFF